MVQPVGRNLSSPLTHTALLFEGKLETEDGTGREAMLKLFKRLDADSDGSVGWDEFSNYMLLEGTTQYQSTFEATRRAVLGPSQKVCLILGSIQRHGVPCSGLLTLGNCGRAFLVLSLHFQIQKLIS